MEYMGVFRGKISTHWLDEPVPGRRGENMLVIHVDTTRLCVMQNDKQPLDLGRCQQNGKVVALLNERHLRRFIMSGVKTQADC
jgi:hypothetical protein